MSNAIFPELAGRQWDIKKVPLFSTRIQQTPNGREARAARMVYPKYEFTLSFDLLRTSANEIQTLMGFYLARRGAFESFLLKDDSDYCVTGQHIAVGDGSTKDFQLIRTYGGFTEPCLNINQAATLNVYLDSVKQESGYSVTYMDSGALSFSSSPAYGSDIKADFSYYYRVRFQEFGEGDDGFTQFMKDLWECGEIRMITAR